MRRLAALLLFSACAKQSAPVATTPPADAPAAPPGAMIGHFLKATAAQDAVIAYDLPAARAAGSAIAQLQPSQYPASFQPHLPALMAAGTRLSGAGTLDDAADAVGQLGATCAACHQALQSGPVIDPVEVPAFGEGEQMARHQWAYDRLWLGLVAADDAAWMQAARELTKVPLPPATAQEGAMRSKEAAALQALVELAKLDLVAQPGERAGLYGRGLAQCGSCHAAAPAAP